jgi:hypothetical protein
MSDGENVFDKQLIEEVGETLKEEKMNEEEKPGLLDSIFGKKEENVEEEKVEEEKGEEKPGLLSSLFGKKEEETKEDEKEKIDCDDLLMKMKECSKEEDISTSCRDVINQWENICNARSWFGN